MNHICKIEKPFYARPAAVCGPSGERRAHTDYERHARQLDAAHHSHTADPAARPIFLRLTQEFPRVRGQVFGAFRECSADVHALLCETATAAAAREWRESGASSHDAA